MMSSYIFAMFCTCILPLCAAEIKKERQITVSELVCELAVRHGRLPLRDLKCLLVVSRHTCDEALKKLEEYRSALQEYVKEKYPIAYCTISYSPDRLSAGIVEKTSSFNRHHERQDFFRYLYYRDDFNEIVSEGSTYLRASQRADCVPFFTNDYLCLDFGIDITSQADEDCQSTGLYWNRKTKKHYVTRFSVACGEDNCVPTGWFVRVLPGLYEKIMQKASFFTYKKSTPFKRSKGPFVTLHERDSGFSIDLAEAGILTEKDVQILSKFVPNGKYAKWSDKQYKRNGYFLLNILVCYGTQRGFLDELDAQVGKKKMKWAGGEALISRCRGAVEILYKDAENRYKTESISDNGYYHMAQRICVSQATINYITQLKKEGVFVERGWRDSKPDFKQILKRYNQAIQFLRHTRMVCFIPPEKKHLLIQYDSLDSSIAIFQGLLRFRCVVEEVVPRNIDLKSITVLPRPFDTGKYKIEYQTVGQLEEDGSESSDVLVESSEGEE